MHRRADLRRLARNTLVPAVLAKVTGQHNHKDHSMPPKDDEKPSLDAIREALVSQAVTLCELGLSVLPIEDNKRPALKSWKQLQATAANVSTVRGWFSNPSAVGIGIILGAISGDLVARDFDDQESYRRWAAAFPSLAGTLPTVETLRGFHVYARVLDCPFKKFGDGELRAGGTHYVVAPPSRLSNGAVYRWKIPLKSLEEVPRLALDKTGFDRCWLPQSQPSSRELTEKTEKTKEPEPTQEDTGVQKRHRVQREQRTTEGEQRTTEGGPRITQDHQCHPSDEFMERAILETCPTALGQRNRGVFDFARWLKSRPEFVDADPRDLEPYVRQWWERACPFIGTKDFDETRADFVRAYGKVKVPIGQSPLDEAFKRAIAAAPPQSALRYEDPLKRQLAALCRELQAASQSNPFYLGCRSAGRLIGISHQQASKWLYLLTIDGLIQVETPGTSGPGGKATRYRYVGGD